MRALFTFLMLIGGAAAARPADRVVIDVDLGRHVISVTKFTPRGRPRTVTGEMLAVVPGTIKPGLYKSRRGRAAGLDNAVFFGRNRSLRTSAHFAEMKAAGRPVAGSVVTTPDFGSLVFGMLGRAGTAPAVVRVRR